MTILSWSWGFKRWVQFNVVQFAETLCVIIEFARAFEGFGVNAVGFNGFALSEVPNFLHLVKF